MIITARDAPARETLGVAGADWLRFLGLKKCFFQTVSYEGLPAAVTYKSLNMPEFSVTNFLESFASVSCCHAAVS